MRDPELTRQKILDVAAAEIHARGFKATSLSDILNAAGISKGALYHHFTNKNELGYAVMEEIFMPMFCMPWRQACQHDDPIAVMSAMFRAFPEHLSEEELEQGCPITNICTEMATIDEGFRQRTETMYGKLIEDIAGALPKSGLREGVDPAQSAMFMLAAMKGIVTVIKSVRCRDTFKILNAELANYLESLRSEESKAAAALREAPSFEMPTCELQTAENLANEE